MQSAKSPNVWIRVAPILIVAVIGYWAAGRWLFPDRSDAVSRVLAMDKVGWAGIAWDGVDADELAKLKVSGALKLRKVAAKGPADKAGVRPGDYLVGVNGKSFSDVYQVQGDAKDYLPGQTIVLNVMRDGARLDFPVTLISMAELEKLQLEGWSL